MHEAAHEQRASLRPGKERAPTNLTTPCDLMALLEIEFDEITPTKVRLDRRGRRPPPAPGRRTRRPLHHAIEMFATTGAYERVKDEGQQAVGVANVTDFVRPHRTGRLNVVAVPIQQGRSEQLWRVELSRPQDGKLAAHGQVRLQNIPASD